MNNSTHQPVLKGLHLGLSILGGILLLTIVLFAVGRGPLAVHAHPIPENEGGYPKLKLSVKTVTPTLAPTGGVTLTYAIEIRNTGAWTATGTTLTDVFPRHTTYISGSAQASAPTTPTVTSDTLTWEGEVGFDSTVVVSFSVVVTQSYSGIVSNTAVISQHLVAEPVTVTAETIVTDAPILTIEKTSEPAKPGANKPLTYTIIVANMGQPMTGTITVTERIPLSTTVRDAGGGVTSTDGTVITWTRNVTMNLRDEEVFTFSVLVDDVLSGTVIANNYYQVDSSETDVTYGEPYTVTVVDPILRLYKSVWPDPPGSNREMTYTLELFNTGSLATGLVITDRLPDGAGSYFRYVGGGVLDSGVVSWSLPRLDTGESAEFAFTIYISDVMGISIFNSDYRACCAEGVCQSGKVLTRVIQGPIFEVFATVIPVAKKTGGEPATPTLGIQNVGNGNAIAATALITFSRFSNLGDGDVRAYLPDGTTEDLPYHKCTEAFACAAFTWVGDIAHSEEVTFTLCDGTDCAQSVGTIGGETGLKYIATIAVTDTLSNTTTPPATDRDWGLITHFASVVPYKSAPKVTGAGYLLTYTIRAVNHGFSTSAPPILTDTVPLSTTFVRASDGGVTQTVITSGTVIIPTAPFVSWTLPLMGPGDEEIRTFTVRVDDDLISGTKIVNSEYSITGYGNIMTGTPTSGSPVTTTVKEIGLIDSYKEVTPTLAPPGPDNVLTYYLYIVNSGPLSLTGVTVDDYLPWWPSTYQRDAVASSGQIVSDIVSIHWTGDVDALATEIVTFTVLIDEDYSGPVTNTAVISHTDLLNEVIVEAVAYITEEPVLEITKWASPDPVDVDGELLYTIRVTNEGQQATGLVISDTIPDNTTYITDSATAGGQLVDDTVVWQDIPALEPGQKRTFQFRVRVGDSAEVRNDRYVVKCREGVIGVGKPVITIVTGGVVKNPPVYLPVIMRLQSQ